MKEMGDLSLSFPLNNLVIEDFRVSGKSLAQCLSEC
jgi:hypothetical protein